MNNPVSYPTPLDQLLTLGETGLGESKLQYADFGIGREHVPDLIRMALDQALHMGDPDSTQVWAPIHACWALGQLRAEEAIPGLLELMRLEDSECLSEDLPHILAMIGSAAFEPVARFFANEKKGNWARITAAITLKQIAKVHPETRLECIARLTQQLESYAQQDGTLNAFIVCELLELEAQDATSLMERAFAEGPIDETLLGDWEDVEIRLGLKAKRTKPRKPNQFTELGEQFLKLMAMNPAPSAAFVPQTPPALKTTKVKVGRNEPCPCGSGQKYKKCCG